ncbi:uncharacterized protein C19orf47 homolog isoform X2 [Pseudomyrmex gracilis]|nr:uncharacterized protein C19orf47 homolog isoform X2 [Pseudomyrmex gracilis]
MLPDLDKPSLKEMGITLMGDRIAILRYAKKVIEETTCERFLVDSEDTPLTTPKVSAKPVVKKIVKDIGNKTTISTTVSKTDPIKKVVKSVPAKKIVTIKKSIPLPNAVNTVNKKQSPLKRKLVSDEDYEDNDEDNWNVTEKKLKATNNNEDNGFEYSVTVPKSSSLRTQVIKKQSEQKRTVFDRLGDSSVTSTTNVVDSTPTFNITGLSKDIFKRPSNVFKRLGDIDDKKDHVTTAGILRNESDTISTSGILKNQTTSARTSIITTKRIVPKMTGTMHADHELSKKATLNSTSRIFKLKKEITNDSKPTSEKSTKPIIVSGKLASERLVSIPAKARLGTAKQVTFNKITTVKHVKKPNVFSRLGV